VRETLYHLGVDAAAVAIHHGLDDLIGDAPVTLFGTAEVTSCAGEVMTAAQFEHALQLADEHVAFAEYLGARDATVALRQRLPCLAEPVDAGLLHRLHLLEGVSRWSLGEQTAAHQAFERAVVLDESYHWGGEFGPRPQEQHILAARAVLDEPMTELVVAWPDPLTTAALDGRPLPLTGGAGRIEVRAGEHLLQVFPPGAEPFHCTIRLTDESVIMERSRFITDLLAVETGDRLAYGGPGSPILAALAQWMEQQGYEAGWLIVAPPGSDPVEGDELPAPDRRRVWHVDVEARDVAVPDVLTDRLKALPWHGNFHLDGGMIAYRRGDNSYFYGKFEASLLLPALPNMAIGWSGGVASFWDPDLESNVIIVPIRVRTRISPDYGTLRPYIDITATIQWLGPHSSAQFAFGPEAGGGIDIRPLRTKVLGCGTGATVGYVGGLTVNVNAGCSVQW